MRGLSGLLLLMILVIILFADPLQRLLIFESVVMLQLSFCMRVVMVGQGSNFLWCDRVG